MFPKLSETFILEEVLGLERAGVPLRLYTLASPADAIAHPAVARVRAPVIEVPGFVPGHRREFALRHLRLFARAPMRYLRTLAAALTTRRTHASDAQQPAVGESLREFLRAGWLAAQLRQDGVAHLHAHFISAPADVAETVSRLTALPFSISAHAKDIYLSPSADLRRKLEAARFTVTCTEFNRRTLAAIAPDARVHRMYHGVDHTQFHPQRRAVTAVPPVILSVGRLREKKGLDTLIDACRVLRDRGEDVRCEIVGYGEEKDRLQARIAAHGLTGNVSLLGKLTRDEVIECYARAAVYVQPSRIAADGDRDGIPNVLLEAMAMGVPVVASNVSGIPELVNDGENGLVVQPDDAVALAGAIARLLREPQMRAALASRARVAVTRSFDNEHNLKLLCRLLEEPRASGRVQHRVHAAGTDERAPQAVLEVE
jgi:glycosyltransferase involved in cell wall biosynthesis